MNRTPFAIFAMLMLIVATIGLAACGGGDDDDDANSDDITAAETSPAADDTSAAEDPTDAPDEEDPTDAPDDGDDDGGDTVALEPCALLTQDEVSAALGEDVQDPVVTYTSTVNLGTGGSQADVGTCNYVSAAGFGSISVTSWFSDDHDGISDMIGLACQGKETINGLGDLACWYDDGHLEIQLGKGGAFVDMFITSSNDTTEIGQTLAEAAVARLN